MEKTKKELETAIYAISPRLASCGPDGYSLLTMIGHARGIQTLIMDLFLDGWQIHDPKHIAVIRYQAEQMHRGKGVDFSGDKK